MRLVKPHHFQDNLCLSITFNFSCCLSLDLARLALDGLWMFSSCFSLPLNVNTEKKETPKNHGQVKWRGRRKGNNLSSGRKQKKQELDKHLWLLSRFHSKSRKHLHFVLLLTVVFFVWLWCAAFQIIEDKRPQKKLNHRIPIWVYLLCAHQISSEPGHSAFRKNLLGDWCAIKTSHQELTKKSKFFGILKRVMVGEFFDYCQTKKAKQEELFGADWNEKKS